MAMYFTTLNLIQIVISQSQSQHSFSVLSQSPQHKRWPGDSVLPKESKENSVKLVSAFPLLVKKNRHGLHHFSLFPVLNADVVPGAVQPSCDYKRKARNTRPDIKELLNTHQRQAAF